tara:strand:+ start:472 stop:891 length:420 start_codon:yes stop_codon:yes gene_type:complete
MKITIDEMAQIIAEEIEGYRMEPIVERLTSFDEGDINQAIAIIDAIPEYGLIDYDEKYPSRDIPGLYFINAAFFLYFELDSPLVEAIEKELINNHYTGATVGNTKGYNSVKDNMVGDHLIIVEKLDDKYKIQILLREAK